MRTLSQRWSVQLFRTDRKSSGINGYAHRKTGQHRPAWRAVHDGVGHQVSDQLMDTVGIKINRSQRRIRAIKLDVREAEPQFIVTQVMADDADHLLGQQHPAFGGDAAPTRPA